MMSEAEDRIFIRQEEQFWDDLIDNAPDTSVDTLRKSYPKEETHSRWQFTRIHLTQRQKQVVLDMYDCCLSCGSQEALQVDHVVPASWGGESEIDNLQVLCASCNSRKGARHSSDYR